MKERFRTTKFRRDSLARIELCNFIIDDLSSQGLRLSLRQLYYQLISRDVMPNSEKSYKALGSLISEARLAGLVDWNAIEDRVRVPRKASEFDDLADLAESALASYRLPRWRGQDVYAELWVEKDALAGVLSPLARQYHAVLMVNRGYSSQSAMYESSKRFIHALEEHSECVLFYLGDHDPSGEDMVRDIADRLAMFGARVEVQKIALTMDQVEEHKPPPNPAKMSDSRAPAYVEKHGESSWEVDALPPAELARLIRNAFDAVINHDMMDAVKRAEEQDKESLRKAVQGILDRPKKRR